MAGDLTGLNLQNPGNLKLIPYALAQAYKDFETKDAKTELDADVGADLKYSITPSLTLDLTYNTDFAQVEVDDQQVNLRPEPDPVQQRGGSVVGRHPHGVAATG